MSHSVRLSGYCTREEDRSGKAKPINTFSRCEFGQGAVSRANFFHRPRQGIKSFKEIDSCAFFHAGRFRQVSGQPGKLAAPSLLTVFRRLPVPGKVGEIGDGGRLDPVHPALGVLPTPVVHLRVRPHFQHQDRVKRADDGAVHWNAIKIMSWCVGAL